MPLDLGNASEIAGAASTGEVACNGGVGTDGAEAGPNTPGQQMADLLGLQDAVVLAGKPGDRIGAQAGKFGTHVRAADEAIRLINSAAERHFGDAEERLSLGLPKVQTALYCAIVDLEEQGLMAEFLADRRVRRHGNTKNPYTPVVSAFARGRHPRVRQTLAKVAAVIALAREDNIEPQNFADWRKNWPVEEACREWRERQARLGSDEDTETTVDLFLASDAEFLPPITQTVGYSGKQLAVIECTQDLSGAFRLVRVLPSDDTSFRRTVLVAMHKKAHAKNRK
jgi:hypothetical protein